MAYCIADRAICITATKDRDRNGAVEIVVRIGGCNRTVKESVRMRSVLVRSRLIVKYVNLLFRLLLSRNAKAAERTGPYNLLSDVTYPMVSEAECQ